MPSIATETRTVKTDPSEEARVNTIKQQASKNGERVSSIIRYYGIKDEVSRIEIAKIAAAENGQAVSQYIKDYDITDQKALIEIAKIAAAENGWGTSYNFRNYNIESEFDRAEIAKIAAKQSGSGTLSYFFHYHITFDSYALEIAKIAILNDFHALTYLAHMRIGKFDTKTFTDTVLEDLMETHSEEDFHQLSDSIKYLVLHHTSPSFLAIKNDEWENAEPHERQAFIVGFLQKIYPSFDDTLLSYATDLGLQDIELISQALAGTFLRWRDVDPDQFGSRARGTLAALSGYNDLPQNKLSSNSERELWGVLLTARELLGGAPSESIPVPFQNRAKALKAITIASSLKGLGGVIPPLKTIDSFIPECLERTRSAFAETLSLDHMSTEELGDLLERWGDDITPFSILAARFSKKDRWTRELPVLSTIAEHVVHGDFHEWRYRNTDEQLSMFNDEQLIEWRKNPLSFQLHKVEQEEQEETNMRKGVADVFETNLLTHLHDADIPLTIENITEQELDELLALPESQQGRELRDMSYVANALLFALEELEDDKLRSLLRAINNGKQKLLSTINSKEMRKQISMDISALKELTQRRKAKANDEFYIVSTLSDDPKLLLMTGDLVQSASCLNYKSGGYVQALPGYVIDGNIKLALSYTVKKEAFERVLKGISPQKREKLTIRFNHPKQTLEILIDSSIVEISLGSALRREVLRVGGNEGQPILLKERAYKQNHPIEAAIKRAQDELVAKTQQRIGAKTYTDVTNFPASRNPLGIYSDKARGIKTGSYQL